MHDLCLISHLDDLRAAGVASLKIEGRLKSPAWVAQAVSLYRHAADKTESPATLRDEADSLGEYTGRMMTNGYFTANRHDLTAPSARPATDKPRSPEPEMPSHDSDSGLTITITDDGQGATLWTFTRGNDTITHRTPRQRIANPRRAISLAAVADNMRGLLPSSEEATITMTPAEIAEKLLPRQAGNAAVDALASFLRHSQKESDGIVRGMALPPEVAAIIAPADKPCPANCRTLGQRPDRCRLTMSQFLAIGRPTPSPYQQWIGMPAVDNRRRRRAGCGSARDRSLIQSLPCPLSSMKSIFRLSTSSATPASRRQNRRDHSGTPGNSSG